MIILAVKFESVSFQKNRYHQHKHKMTGDIPVISIKTDEEIPSPYILDKSGARERNQELVNATVNYRDEKSGLNIEEKANIRTRGRSSRSFEKKGYYLKFKKENLKDNKKVSLAGMTEDSEWVLHGPYMDKTLIRNYLCYNLAGEIMEYSPNVRYCEMFLNGEYKGLYLIVEKVEYNDEGRISITESDPDSRQTSYILRLDVGAEDELHSLDTFSYYTGKNGPSDKSSEKLEIIYPGKTLTQDQKRYIEDGISEFEKSLVSFDSGDRRFGYHKFIDVDSFVDYFIINEFTMNSDAAKLSTYYYKDIRGKIKMVVWDFNSAFDNYVAEMSEPHHFVMIDKFWYEYLLRDRYFVDKVVKRYYELRKSYLSDEYLLNYIDETMEYLGPAVKRNNEVWGYSYSKENDLLYPERRNPRSYEEAVQQLKEMVIERGEYLDANIETLYSLSHDSANKQFRHKGGRQE